MRRIYWSFSVLLILGASSLQGQAIEGKWSAEKANRWYQNYDWLAGTNFSPSTAINQLEMWQAETFDLETIDKELKWSAELGFNLHRVYLHNLVWQQNSEAFLNRIDQYLETADKYGIKTMFVLLDDVWDPMPALGKQREPIKGLHNSGWVQAPGREYLEDTSKHPLIEAYVKGVIQRFKNDNRVIAWDLYNEPGNPNENSYGQSSKHQTELTPSEKDQLTLVLVKKVFKWAREIAPSQPLTMGIWRGDISKWGTIEELPLLDQVMIQNSDVITFHTYDDKLEAVKLKIDLLKNYNRPIICTEYMARTNNNLFKDLMPLFKKENIGAINWGFVSGKTNTIYPWKTWQNPYEKEPEVWFHDILRKDGTPYSQAEVDLIKSLTKK